MLRRLISGEDTGIYIIVGTPFLYIEETKTMVLADLHLGFEEAASRGLVYSTRRTGRYAAIFIPRIQLRKTIDMLSVVLQRVETKRVIINGDLKHAFDRLLRQEKEETIKLIDSLRELGIQEVTVIRGNHDNFIKPLLKRLNVNFARSLLTISRGKRVLLTHGHEEVDLSESDIVIIGHEHPSIHCFEVYRFPCFLKVPLAENKLLVVMPATGPYHPGVVVNPNTEEYLSPLIRKLGSLGSMSIVIWMDLGEVPPNGVGYLETYSTNMVEVERAVVDNREYALVEFNTYEAARLLCSA
ncbi:MAG: metallophosphoesterase [Desulfurococcaceae archaeon]